MKQKQLSKFVAVILLTLLASCSSQDQSKESEVVLGAALHLTENDYSSVGAAMQEGIDLAVSEQNSMGGINGKKVRVVYEDTQNNNAKAVTGAQKLINVDGAQAVLVSTFSEAMAIGPVFEEQKVPLIVLWDSNEDLENIGDYVFSTGVWTKAAGERIAKYASNDLKIKNVAIIKHATAWSQSVAGFFKEEFTAKGGRIIFEDVVMPETTDFRTTIAKAKKSNPDAVFAPADRNLGVFFRQVKESGFEGYVLSSDAVTQQAIDSASGGAEGLFYTTFSVPDSDVTKEFVRKYKEKYNKETDQLAFVGFGYDGAKAVLKALEMGASNSQEVNDNLYKIKGLKGSFGEIAFNAKGSAPKYEAVFTVKNGKETFVKV